MRAYAIYAGGGVKGAALAGCLRAAEQQDITFVGHGGTSAGSMIAVLAAVGYDGQELETLLVEELAFNTLLDDGGNELRKTLEVVDKVSEALSSGGLFGKFKAINCTAPGVLRKLGTKLGLYTGDKLKKFLIEKIKFKVKSVANHADITFEHLHRAKCLPVKVVASDITLRRPAIFSLDQSSYGASVIEAVRASTCYPFAFEPVMLNGRRLVDGGLSSNLPVFLFAEEYRQTRIPAIAFDLIAPEGGVAAANLASYGRDLLYTALEASDDLLRKVLKGVHYIPVLTPPGIGTLDFGLQRDDRKRLFDAGHKATTDFLATFEPLKRLKVAGDQLQKMLWAEYGPPQIFTPILHALAKEIEQSTKAENVRANLMLPTGRGTRIVTYSWGMDTDPDIDLELPENAGCSGKAWVDRSPAFADLVEASKVSGWDMTKEQHAKVPPNRKSMISVPVHREMIAGETRPLPAAILSVDSTTPLDETGFLDSKPVLSIMMTWACIAHRLFP